MNDLKQIRVLIEALTKQKDKYLNELTRLNANINVKNSMIEKMQSYRSNYLNNCELKNNQTSPMLYKNSNLFIIKIDQAIEHTQKELHSLNKIKISLFETIDKVNKKIEVINVFDAKTKKDLKEKEDKREQVVLDDIASTMRRRQKEEA